MNAKQHSTPFRVGAGVSTAVFLIMFTSIVFFRSFLIKNWPIYAGILLTYLFFFTIIPHFFPREQNIKQMKEGSLAFAQKLNNGVVAIALSIAYILGVGLARIITKVFGMKLMPLQSKNTQTFWSKLPEVKDKSEYENMY